METFTLFETCRKKQKQVFAKKFHEARIAPQFLRLSLKSGFLFYFQP
jgi:hypothetical protein